MELYVAVGLAVVTILLIRQKRRGSNDGGVEMEISSPIIKPLNNLPMDIDEAILTCTPQQPPSPMSTSSGEEAFIIDSSYIK